MSVNNKNSIYKVFLIALAVVLTTGWSWPSDTNKSKPAPKSVDVLQKEYDQLKEKFNALKADRNNVLEQTKALLLEKAKAVELKESYDKLLKIKVVLSKETARLHALAVKSSIEKKSAQENFNRLKKSYAVLETEHETLMAANEALKTALKSNVESSPQFKKLNADLNTLKNENTRLLQSNKSLDDNLKKAFTQIKTIENKNTDLDKENRAKLNQIAELSAEKEKMTALNKELNQIVTAAPKRFKDMANENKTMLNETARMHYNMGVLFIRNRETDRAIKEFQRALDFNPNNPQVHYNLGYLFSEEYEKHDLAMFHFKKYLELNPNSKEAHEVRSYLMVREAYGDKIAN